MKKIKSVIVLFLVLLVAIFAVQNSEIIEIQFLFWSFSTPRVLLILSMIFIGFFIGISASSISAIKKPVTKPKSAA